MTRPLFDVAIQTARCWRSSGFIGAHPRHGRGSGQRSPGPAIALNVLIAFAGGHSGVTSQGDQGAPVAVPVRWPSSSADSHPWVERSQARRAVRIDPLTTWLADA
jgi:hypothetical protein